jgi:hypothetical protein
MAYTDADLSLATRHVANGERHVISQRRILAELTKRGRPTRLAADLLDTFERSLRQHVAHRDKIAVDVRLTPRLRPGSGDRAQRAIPERKDPQTPARYFLHVREGDFLAEDSDGVELPDLATARALAVTAGREMLAERLLAGEPIDGLRIVICALDGSFLEQVCFDDFVRLGRRSSTS